MKIFTLTSIEIVDIVEESDLKKERPVLGGRGG